MADNYLSTPAKRFLPRMAASATAPQTAVGFQPVTAAPSPSNYFMPPAGFSVGGSPLSIYDQLKAAGVAPTTDTSTAAAPTIPLPSNGIAPFTGLPYGTSGTPTNFDSVSNYLKGPTASDVYSPGTQTILDLLKKQGETSRTEGVSAAQSLAAKRGLTGSSIEQFGTAQAGAQADKATIDAQISTLNNAMSLANQRSLAGASLTSDELASIRNYQSGQQSLGLQKDLGQQSIDVARQNAQMASDNAKKQAEYGLYGSLGSALLPSLLSGAFGGNSGAGGLLSSLFSGGGTQGGGLLGGLQNFLGMGGGMAANGGAPAPIGAGSSLFPNGLGMYPATAPAGAGFFGSMGAVPGAAALAGAGYGSMELAKAAEGLFGKTAGDVLNPIGSQLNVVKNLFTNPTKTISNAASSVSNAVSSIFPF